MPAQGKILCLGDSHTRALYGTDWVGQLSSSVAGKLQVVRAGKGGEWAILIGNRLEPLLDVHSDPVAVVILAGTNDALASISPAMMQLYRWGFPALKDKVSTLEGYEASMECMLSTLSKRLPNCRVAVLTLPPIGEDLDDFANGAVRRHNQVLTDLVARYSRTAQLVDFHAACVRHLRELRGRRPPPLGLMTIPSVLYLQLGSLFQHYILRRPWDAIARSNGLCLLTDQIHLNDTCGRILLREIQPFVDSLKATAQGAAVL